MSGRNSSKTQEPIEFVRLGFDSDYKMVCPECDSAIALSPQTECDTCGAHFRVDTVLEAPAIEARSEDDE